MDMRQWMKDYIENEKKRAIPVLSFPSVSLLGIGVRELISDPALQARGMKIIADRVPSGASFSMMDLSLEAEAFGSTIRVSDDEVPTVIGAIVTDEDEADALRVPKVGDGRTGLYIDAIGQAVELIQDRPVFAGTIGPFSLAGRLMDVSEALANCIAEPDMVHKVMEKTTEFLIEYINGYKAVGAHGVVMAEPLTGILSPALAAEFSEPYVRRIVEATQTDDFALIYHNCGNNTILMAESIARTGAMGFHFGNSINMAEMLPKMPGHVLVMGNIDPAGQFRNGTPESVYESTSALVRELAPKHSNFVISSGCDIPPLSPWANIDSFFKAVTDYTDSIPEAAVDAIPDRLPDVVLA